MFLRGAGACSGAFIFRPKLFSGKAQDVTRDENRATH